MNDAVATTISQDARTPPAHGSFAGAARWARRVVLALLVVAILWAGLWLAFSDTGAQIREDPRAFGVEVKAWVRDHPVSAPAMYVGFYVLASLLALPMWWILIIAGYCFGSATFGVI